MTPSLILIGLGLMLLIEGAMYSLAPRGMQRLMALLSQLPESQVRMLGVTSAVLGFLVIAVLTN